MKRTGKPIRSECQTNTNRQIIVMATRKVLFSAGPVSIESGKTTLYGSSVIYNDFGVKYGAELEIK